MSGLNAEQLREQFEIESQQGRYSTEGIEPIENNGAFNDAYVEWLENRLANGVTTGEKQCNLPVVSQQRELFYNFITWYNAKPKIKKPKDGLITTTIIEEYLKL